MKRQQIKKGDRITVIDSNSRHCGVTGQVFNVDWEGCPEIIIDGLPHTFWPSQVKRTGDWI